MTTELIPTCFFFYRKSRLMSSLKVLCFALLVIGYMHSWTAQVHARWAEDLPLEPVDTEQQKKEMMSVLHNVLKDIHRRRMAILERRFSRLPGVCKRLRKRIRTILCNVSNTCSVKKGSRQGQLCRCPRGSKCNYFFLKRY
ncbi:hypothetical protein AAFF_G00250640 [Aldrovandia affinis]|uniref:Cocaine- and amphetamine-regulated transcript protein n=1 Tax=Aldrovandia affinis TaxID=143900 RepID=A0AAD7RDG4_9TELE|nr:hypothetical protein AAFF_G00250640 [Aldrovandia affinis]